MWGKTKVEDGIDKWITFCDLVQRHWILIMELGCYYKLWLTTTLEAQLNLNKGQPTSWTKTNELCGIIVKLEKQWIFVEHFGMIKLKVPVQIKLTEFDDRQQCYFVESESASIYVWRDSTIPMANLDTISWLSRWRIIKV